MSTGNRGEEAIARMFEGARKHGRAAFLPYYPIGYPDYGTSIEIIAKMADIGVDGFEIGMPFSDPLADGPTIAAATDHALRGGINTARCLEAVRELRERGVDQPLLLMGYLNPILAYGPEIFVAEAREAGADGLIVPDLPPEERGLLEDPCRNSGLALVAFLAPNGGPRRITLAAEKATGFIYIVSVTGITGARESLPDTLPAFLDRVRAQTDKPLVVGFGISRPEQARAMGEIADGFIVGSALVRAAEEGIDAVIRLAETLRNALDA